MIENKIETYPQNERFKLIMVSLMYEHTHTLNLPSQSNALLMMGWVGWRWEAHGPKIEVAGT